MIVSRTTFFVVEHLLGVNKKRELKDCVIHSSWPVHDRNISMMLYIYIYRQINSTLYLCCRYFGLDLLSVAPSLQSFTNTFFRLGLHLPEQRNV